MAKIISHSPFIVSGKLGDRVYFSRNGVQYSRKLPTRKARPYQESMKPQQEKFSRLVRLLRPLVPLFRLSFTSFAHHMSGFNKAISCNLHNGFMAEPPSFAFDFSKLLLSEGFVASPGSITVQTNESGALLFTWKGKRGRGSVSIRDHLYVAAYCETLNKWIFDSDAAFRRDGTCVINLPELKGNPVHIYAGFISAYGRGASCSEYMGIVKI